MTDSFEHDGGDDHAALERLQKIVTDVRVAMITTKGTDGEMHSRPMYLQEMQQNGTLWFATSDDSPLAAQIRDDARVIATFADPSDRRFAVIRGRASLHRDPARIAELWNAGMQAWFPDGPSDPSITLVRMHGEHGDYWDAPGRPAGVVEFLGALLTGTRPDGGERVHVDMDAPSRQIPETVPI